MDLPLFLFCFDGTSPNGNVTPSSCRTHLQDRRVDRNLHILPASVRRKDDNGLVCRHGDQRNLKRRRVAESGGGLVSKSTADSEQLARADTPRVSPLFEVA